MIGSWSQMKSSQSFFSDISYYITPSDIIEFNYCKRFIYYMKVLGIPQNEETRFKVQQGRNIHTLKEKRNKEYLRSKIKAVKKLNEVSLVSEKFKIKGKVDEINFLEDGTAVPLDYKFAEYKDQIYKTYKTQMVMYSIMIEEMFDVEVKAAYIVYCRSSNKLVKIDISESMKIGIKDIIKEYAKVLCGHYPKATKSKSKCFDCCYRNICIS